MTKTRTAFAKGDLLMFSCGAYSDYTVAGVVVALKDLDLCALAKRAKAEGVHPDGLLPWLVKGGYVEATDHTEVWSGAYGKWAAALGGDQR